MGKWEKSKPELVEKFYRVMENFDGIKLSKMFGYPCAYVNGHLFVGLHEQNVTVRLAADVREQALESGRGSVFAPMKGRIMKEYVALSQEIIDDEDEFREMVEQSLAYVGALPPK